MSDSLGAWKPWQKKMTCVNSTSLCIFRKYSHFCGHLQDNDNRKANYYSVCYELETIIFIY